MISKPSKKQTLVYNTKTNKTYPIHPAMAQDKAWMAARGLIVQDELKPFEVTNMDQVSPASPPATKTKTNK